MPSPNSVLSPLPTRSEYLSTLPLWRRCLAMLNWRPVYAIEQQTRLHEISSLDSEKRLLASEKLMLASEKRLLDSERRTRQLESEIALLKASNARLARDERELFCCANPVPSTDNSSPS